MQKVRSINNIKNIIFDFGGVIINIDHRRVEDEFIKLGVENFDKLFNEATQSDLFRNLEKGIISPPEFRQAIREMSGIVVSDEIIDNTWNLIIGDYPVERIELLKQIKKHYRIFLLSNTNKIHYDFYISKFKKEFGFEFSSLFDRVYMSFQIGMRKPDFESYLYVLNQNNLRPVETLFVDDAIQNIFAAEELNIIGYHLKSDYDITDLFTEGKLKDNI